SRAKHRQVERSAVEGGEAFGRLELVPQRVEERGFHAGLWQKELRHPKATVDGTCDRGRENVGARTSGQAGSLGVDIGDVSRVGVEDGKGEHVLADRGDPKRRPQLFEAPRQLAASRRPWPGR